MYHLQRICGGNAGESGENGRLLRTWAGGISWAEGFLLREEGRSRGGRKWGLITQKKREGKRGERASSSSESPWGSEEKKKTDEGEKR